jgi:hypothetical protein
VPYSGLVWKGRFLILAAVLIAYLPAIDNGFIADDYVILHRIDLLKEDPFYLYSVVPENFRLTTYIAFGTLRGLFEYDSRPFYLFNILLHATNCLLLCRIVRDITRNSAIATATAVFFAVFQAPQEAVMWLAAMNETLCAFFLFVTLLLWFKNRYYLASLTFFVALFSKETAVLFVLLLPVIEWLRGRRSPTTAYLALAVPAAIFASIFLWTFGENFQVGQGTYALGFHALVVFFKSLHRLLWPWGYIAALSVWWMVKEKVSHNAVAWAALIPITMLPYVFVTYASNIPSRQVYLPSAILLGLFAVALWTLPSKVYRHVLIAAFVAFNIFYMWTVKDAQMVKRAAPTTQLREELARHSPTSVRIRGFEYPFAGVANTVALTLPGWRWEDVDLAESCRQCLFLDWDRPALRYRVQIR